MDRDLTPRLGPIEPVRARVDPLLAYPIRLAPDEFDSLVVFVRSGLLDPRAELSNRAKSYRRLCPVARRRCGSRNAPNTEDLVQL